MIDRLVGKVIYNTADEEVRRLAAQLGAHVWVHYTTMSYRHDMEYITELCEEVRKDFPDIKDRDMEVYTLTRDNSERHAGHTVVSVRVDAERYIEMRKNGLISPL